MAIVSNLMAPCDADILAEAEACCHRELRLRPDQPDRLHLLGLIAARSARWNLALACLARAVARSPRDLTYALDLADSYAATGRDQQAYDVYTTATMLAPDEPRAYRGIGRMLTRLSRPLEAELALRRALQLDATHGPTHGNLGDLRGLQNQWGDALPHYDRWRELCPTDGHPYAHAGRACLALQTPRESAEWFRRGLTVDESLTELHVGLGTSLLRLGDIDVSLEAFRAALTLDPIDLAACQGFVQTAEFAGRRDEAASGWYRLGCAFEARRRLAEAESAFRRALERHPDSVVGLLRLAEVVLRLQRPLEATALFERTLSLRPQSRLAHIGLGMAAHAAGDLQRGWREFRWYQREDAEESRDFEQPLWDGAALDGRTILVWADWALGDAIQFIRYVPLVQAMGGRVVIECHARLLPLFSRMAGVARAIARGTALPPFDVHAPLCSLPRIFDTSVASIPAAMPYLSVDDCLRDEWTQRLASLAPTGLPAIGLVWAGEPDRPNARMRFTTLTTFARLARAGRVRFISLQQGRSSIELVAPPAGLRVETFEEESRSIADSAALMANLDLVITVDTMVAHLAGALARPVWTLLPHGPDWRWQSQGDTTPWYPTMRLFRQPRPDDWASVMERVVTALADFTAQHQRTAAGRETSAYAPS